MAERQSSWTVLIVGSLVAPFFMSWYFSSVAFHNGRFPPSVFVTSGCFTLFTVCAAYLSPFKMWEKILLVIASFGAQVLAAVLGAVCEFLQDGIGLGV